MLNGLLMQNYLYKKVECPAAWKKWMFVLLIIPTFSCNYFTYRHHTAKQRYFARPNVLFMDGIINYHTQNQEWPNSLQQFANSSAANHQLVQDFKYYNADFKVINNTRLKVHFYNYKREPQMIDTDGRIDLNALHGVMRFTKTNQGYTWKIKM